MLEKGVMHGLHSATKGQREMIRQLVHAVLIRDMATFNPERFKEWIKNTDASFRKQGLTLQFRIHNRAVHFTIKEIRTARTAYQFTASTHVSFEDNEVVMAADEIIRRSF